MSVPVPAKREAEARRGARGGGDGAPRHSISARRGFAVTLIDAADAPLSAASRWNEGKIHLGYLYANDASLYGPGVLSRAVFAFADLMRELLGFGLEAVTSAQDEMDPVHRNLGRRSTRRRSGFRRPSAHWCAIIPAPRAISLMSRVPQRRRLPTPNWKRSQTPGPLSPAFAFQSAQCGLRWSRTASSMRFAMNLRFRSNCPPE